MKRFFGKPRHLELAVPLTALFLGILIMLFGEVTVSQAGFPSLLPQSFRGEYSRDGETWFPLEPDSPLSALEGDLYLQGRFSLPVQEDTLLYYYSDHIGAEIQVDGVVLDRDLLLDLSQYGLELQPSMCGRGWKSWYFEEAIPEDALIRLHLSNPHRFGNSGAYRVFLQTLCGAPSGIDLLSHWLSGYSRPFQVAGILLILTALLLLGASGAAFAMRIPTGGRLTKLGLLSGLAGGYLVFDSISISLWSDLTVLNTYGHQLCMILTVYLVGIIAKDSLTGRRRQAALWVTGLSCAANTLLILLSCTGAVLIYDTLLPWLCLQMLINGFFLVCCSLELAAGKKHPNPELIFCLLLFLALSLDCAGMGSLLYSRGNWTKAALGAYFIYIFFRGTGNIVADHKASIRAKKLEQELEESRVAVMLSQIQPHFIFNVLGTIRGLCREDAEQAWKALGDFSTYLRGNMNALTNTKFIPFSRELQHVETYLRLEKMRLGDKLSIVYDIREQDFSLPPLTLQPLVENAVKHGIFYKKEGGTVVIQSRQESGKILLTVQDNGLGFDPHQPPETPRSHESVGIENVRSRVTKMLGGSLSVESRINCGTTVTIEFPRKNTQGGAEENHVYSGS